MHKLINIFVISIINFLLPEIKAQEIPGKLKELNSKGIPTETSGLCIVNSIIYSINDSGNPSEIWTAHLDSLYAGISTWKRIKINVNNIDWEAIETDDDKKHLYIGEFGNNKGKRRDLKIIKIPIDGNSINVDLITNIEFDYEDYSKRVINNNISTKGRKMHNFDCEAFWVLDSSIYLFTKNWGNKKCNVYKIPNQPGKHVAKKIGQFDPGFLVTDCVKVGDSLFYCGYSLTGNQYIGNVSWGNWTNCNRKKLNIKPAQFEAITWDSEKRDFILSSESRKSQKASLFIPN